MRICVRINLFSKIIKKDKWCTQIIRCIIEIVTNIYRLLNFSQIFFTTKFRDLYILRDDKIKSSCYHFKLILISRTQSLLPNWNYLFSIPDLTSFLHVLISLPLESLKKHMLDRWILSINFFTRDWNWNFNFDVWSISKLENSGQWTRMMWG